MTTPQPTPGCYENSNCATCRQQSGCAWCATNTLTFGVCQGDAFACDSRFPRRSAGAQPCFTNAPTPVPSNFNTFFDCLYVYNCLLRTTLIVASSLQHQRPHQTKQHCASRSPPVNSAPTSPCIRRVPVATAARRVNPSRRRVCAQSMPSPRNNARRWHRYAHGCRCVCAEIIVFC